MLKALANAVGEHPYAAAAIGVGAAVAARAIAPTSALVQSVAAIGAAGLVANAGLRGAAALAGMADSALAAMVAGRAMRTNPALTEPEARAATLRSGHYRPAILESADGPFTMDLWHGAREGRAPRWFTPSRRHAQTFGEPERFRVTADKVLVIDNDRDIRYREPRTKTERKARNQQERKGLSPEDVLSRSLDRSGADAVVALGWEGPFSVYTRREGVARQIEAP